MDGSDFHAWWTAALLVAFLGIVIWAWSRNRQSDFDEAARLPLDDEKNSSGDSP